MAKTLQMVFLNTIGKTTAISISDVKETATAAEIKALMELIVARNIFTSTGGDLTTVMEASLVSRDVEPVAVK